MTGIKLSDKFLREQAKRSEKLAADLREHGGGGKTYEPHPLADIFPLLDGEAQVALAGDIRTNGLREPIVLHEGKILDGRNRYEACLLAEVAPRFVDYDGDDPRAFVISMNVHRRHLDQQQKRDLVEKLLRESPEHSDNRIADAVGVTDKTVTSVRDKLESTSEIPKLERTIGKDGKSRPAKRTPTKTRTAKDTVKQPAPTPPKIAKVIVETPEPTPPKIVQVTVEKPEPTEPKIANVTVVDDGLDIPPALRRTRPKAAPVEDAAASARRRKAEYALMEAIEGGYLDELADAIARTIADRRAAA
jgi:hypothetical protein